ncbi:hypothetical protein [Natronorubrum sp. DTA7]|uniref:hypothetical protein n=1 Tax=Natronorubrum sp. DTA7 TaxID=3447016 RepID=UPI003F842528
MRLTPPWFRSSSEDPPREDSDGDPDTSAGVTIYHSPPSDLSEESSVSSRRAAHFIPESDTALIVELDEMSTPSTVDEVVDQLIAPADPPVETWATVHERLHRDRLPALDASNDIVFDESQGVVERPLQARSGTQNGVAVASSAVSTTAPFTPSRVFLALLSLALLGAAVFVVITVVV